MIKLKINGKQYTLPQLIQFATTHILPANCVQSVDSGLDLKDLETFLKLGINDAGSDPDWVDNILRPLSKFDDQQLGFVDAIIKSPYRVDPHDIIKWAMKRDYTFFPADMDDAEIGEQILLTMDPMKRTVSKYFDLEKFISELADIYPMSISHGFAVFGPSIKPSVDFSFLKERNPQLKIQVTIGTYTCINYCEQDKQEQLHQYIDSNELDPSEFTVRTNAPWLDLSDLSLTDLTTLVNGLNETGYGCDLYMLHCLYDACNQDIRKVFKLFTDDVMVFKHNGPASILDFCLADQPVTVEELLTEKCELFFDLEQIAINYKQRFKVYSTNSIGTYLMV